MKTNRRIHSALKIALMTGSATCALGLTPNALAQTDEQVEEITVTGSRISKRDAIAESPIFTVDQDTLKVSGYVTLDQYLNTLPQITPNISSQSNNPSSAVHSSTSAAWAASATSSLSTVAAQWVSPVAVPWLTPTQSPLL